jgi:hypothetical protein
MLVLNDPGVVSEIWNEIECVSYGGYVGLVRRVTR